MRKILRTAAKGLSVFPWIAKGLLLIVALAALILWPLSQGRKIGVDAQRYTAAPASGELRVYVARCSNGRAIVGYFWQHAWDDPGLSGFREKVETDGDGWRWAGWWEMPAWDEGEWSSHWGPLRWDFFDANRPNGLTRLRHLNAPLWTIALAAGVWPLASIALALHRRRRRKRAAREGRCEICGYDLRATPQKGGALLARCPECGADSAASQRAED